MPRRPDVPCAGTCGRLMWRGTGGLPPGEAMCRQCRLAHPATRVGKACTICQRETLGRRTTCSAACFEARLAQVQELGAASRRRPEPHRCEVCSAAFRPTYGGQRTCGRTCGVVLKERNRPPQLVEIPNSRPAVLTLGSCRVCSKAFFATSEREHCSPRCSKVFHDRSYRLRHYVPRKCADCGGAVATARKKCDGCVHSTRRATKRRQKSRRVCRVREPYTLAEIANRDAFKCGLCRKRVPMNRAVPDHLAPTIDHLIPISDGGDDVRANVQLAHFICNSRRRTGGVVQLALVG